MRKTNILPLSFWRKPSLSAKNQSRPDAEGRFVPILTDQQPLEGLPLNFCSSSSGTWHRILLGSRFSRAQRIHFLLVVSGNLWATWEGSQSHIHCGMTATWYCPSKLSLKSSSTRQSPGDQFLLLHVSWTEGLNFGVVLCYPGHTYLPCSMK